MVDNIFLEVKNFLNDSNKLTLEIEFECFNSTVYKGFGVVFKELDCKKTTLKVFLVKSQILGRTTLYFRDSPIYTFSLTIDDYNLFNDNSPKELIIENFVVLSVEPIGGNQLIIAKNLISVYASINDGKKRDSSSLTLYQCYTLPIASKSYDYVLDFNLLTNTPKEVRKTPTNSINSQNLRVNTNISPEKSNNNLTYLFLIILVVTIGLIISDKNNQNSNTEFPTETVDGTLETTVDTSATIIETNETTVDTTLPSATSIESTPTISIIQEMDITKCATNLIEFASNRDNHFHEFLSIPSQEIINELISNRILIIGDEKYPLIDCSFRYMSGNELIERKEFEKFKDAHLVWINYYDRETNKYVKSSIQPLDSKEDCDVFIELLAELRITLI